MDTIIKTNVEIIKQDVKTYKGKIHEINIKCVLEIVFVIDITASMGPYINESKITILEIIITIEKTIPKTEF